MSKELKIAIFSVLYILGILSFISSYTLLISICVFVLLLFILFYKKLISTKLFFVYSFAFFFAVFNTSINIKYDDDLTAYDNENLTVLAKVISIPSNNIKDKTKFYAQVSSLTTQNGELLDVKAKSLITINDSTEKIKEIKIGNILEINGKIKTPNVAKNPSQFDYAKYLQYKKTFSLMYAEDNWRIVQESNSLKGKFLQKLNDKRNEILKIHSQNIQSPMLEILGGIIFGDDAVNPDEETKSDFINSGIFHILAASGMNVTLIFGIWFFFAVKLRFNYKLSITTGILLILVYTCMTGFGPPIIRAFLMLTLILIGKLIDRKTSTMSLLFVVGILMLIVNPFMLFDIGFQLSFVVTFALILTAPLLVFNTEYKYLNNILGACLIPVIAQLYAAPLQMFYFNTFSVYSVFANIAIIPVLSLISFVGFVSSIIAMLPVISSKICYIADLLLNPFLIYITKVAGFFSHLPFSIVDVKKPALIQIFMYFSILISITLILRYKVKSKKIIYSVVCLIFIFCLSFLSYSQKCAEIIFFSVGNADMIMLKSPNNQYFMVDTGKIAFKNTSSQAKNIEVKYLKDKGIKTVNSLILTHYDSDHAGGTIDILKNLRVKTLYNTDIVEDTKLSANIIHFVDEHKINSVNVNKTMEIYNENGFKITIIKPQGDKITSENQMSLIVHCQYKNENVLLMGDGDINSFDVIPDEFKRNLSVIKIGHHGGQNTLNRNMINNSAVYIISTGKNIYNHPNSQTIKLLEDTHSQYYRTDNYNAVKITFNKENREIYLYSPKMKQFIREISQNTIR